MFQGKPEPDSGVPLHASNDGMSEVELIEREMAFESIARLMMLHRIALSELAGYLGIDSTPERRSVEIRPFDPFLDC